MTDPQAKSVPPQSAQTTTKKRRARRITDVMPALRKRVGPLFHAGVTVDRLAVDLGIPPVAVLEHVVREYTGSLHPGPVLAERKPVQPERSEITVRELKAKGAAA